jgi:hypothetical protein
VDQPLIRCVCPRWCDWHCGNPSTQEDFYCDRCRARECEHTGVASPIARVIEAVSGSHTPPVYEDYENNETVTDIIDTLERGDKGRTVLPSRPKSPASDTGLTEQ